MKTIIALAVAAIGTGASLGLALALDGPGRALAPSDTVLGFANDPVLDGQTGQRVRRSFIPPYSGVVRVKWDVKSTNGTQVNTSADVPHISNCQRPTSSTAFVTKVCNVRVVGGLPVNIEAVPSDPGNATSLRNVRLYYRVIDSTGESVEYELPASPG